jgi:tetratricopeptide (TPR) repeat protein
MPRVYLGRLAREDGDIPRATAYLDTAIRLDTTNAVAFREMGQLQLYAQRPQLAVSFFRRAIERDQDDRVAQGWMACALSSAGNADLAERFYSRAGAGDWTACRRNPAAAGQLPPGGVVPPPAGLGGPPRQPLTP